MSDSSPPTVGRRYAQAATQSTALIAVAASHDAQALAGACHQLEDPALVLLSLANTAAWLAAQVIADPQGEDLTPEAYERVAQFCRVLAARQAAAEDRTADMFDSLPRGPLEAPQTPEDIPEDL